MCFQLSSREYAHNTAKPPCVLPLHAELLSMEQLQGLSLEDSITTSCLYA